MNNKEIREKLFELADPKYKDFHSSLCPGNNNIIGVRVPVLREFAKELLKEDFREYLKNPNDYYYEETMLQAMVIGLAKDITIEETLKYLKKFIPKINNWAICDTCVAGLKITKKNMKAMWDFLQTYLNSQNEFEIRFAVVMMLDFYLTDEYIDNVLEKLNEIKHEGYYVKMSVAWIISMAYIKQKEKTIEFLKHTKLDDFTYNKALQKILESYQVTYKEKQTIRKMKRK